MNGVSPFFLLEVNKYNYTLIQFMYVWVDFFILPNSDYREQGYFEDLSLLYLKWQNMTKKDIHLKHLAIHLYN